jgi:glycosyltransferase involved in cell wall biosynthesis
MTFEVTIPVLNEAETLQRQVLLLRDFLLMHFPQIGQWKIIIADNGSTDRTFDIAIELNERYPEIIPMKVPSKGVGKALKHSWSQSSADIVGYMDLDLATDLKHFAEAYDALANQGYELVYASRLHPRSLVIGRTLKREFTSRALNFILKVYLGTRFSDGMCGFKWMRRSVYPALNQGGAVSDGWFFSTELLAVAEWQGLRVLELPVKWTDDVSSSRVRIVKLALQYLAAMKVLKSRRPPVN